MCQTSRPISRFPRHSWSDRHCHRVFCRMADDLRGGDMDMPSTTIAHSSHWTSSNVHIFIDSSICVSPLCFPLHTPRDATLAYFWALSVVDMYVCYIGGHSLEWFSCLASSVYILEDCYVFRLPGKRDPLSKGIVLACVLPAPMVKSDVQHLVSVISFETTWWLITERLMTSYRLQVVPSLPLSVVTFTAYLLLLDIRTTDKTTLCSIVPWWWCFA